jgi:predicted Zn-dependent protease
MTAQFPSRSWRGLAPLALAAGLAACGVSTQQEVQLGEQASQQVQQQLPLLQDPEIVRYVNVLGDSMAKLTSRADLPWQFFVVNTSDVNAFALPGGIIYVNRGILEHASNMSELAGVMGHEIEHVVLRHSVKQMQDMQGAQIGVALACALTGVCNNQAAASAINLGGTLAFAKLSRTDEKQADDGGFQNVLRAGINPTGMLTFFQKLLDVEKSAGADASSVNLWFSDHPGTEDRITDIQSMLSQVPASRLSHLTTDTPEFDRIKQRVMNLPPAPKPQPPPGQ